MSGNWKPGDVALVEAGCWANRKVALRLAEGWSHVNGVSLDDDGIVTPLRPLIVIDPEDREQVAAVFKAIVDGTPKIVHYPDEPADHHEQAFIDAAQVTFRSLLAEPEPTELGTVVDGKDGKWVNVGNGDWYSVVRGDTLKWSVLGPTVRPSGGAA